MEINQIIALNLNKIRIERQLTLDQLAALTQLSKAVLSQIEKGDTNPTINTIWKICDGLNIPYTSLLESQIPTTASVMTKERALFQSEDQNRFRVYCYYSDTSQRNFELFQIEIDPGANYTSIGHSKKSDEYIMVLEGELTLTANQQTLTIKTDEATTFKANSPHTYENRSNQLIKAILINYYPY
ncbi:helix-turn-helix domain-containing protein [Vagococcus silagei]|uniref:XRE family transcriptional regulator n=1 Tax=Vagococcus silagei TaxID=2508885 RepID=A0A4S3B2P2_9ENTE|nr:XRE family transcriptional regulator [Vagococcus silagei]THB61082.1 XRE family transcriptional regulator [Vagococcus silagei]